MNFIARFFLFLPRSFALKLGVFLGVLSFYVLRKRRRLALDNLNQALGNRYTPQQQKNIIKKVFINLSLNFVEFFRFQEVTKDTLSTFATIHGLDNLEKAYRENKGVFMLTGHIGNWEMLGASFTLTGFKGGLLTKSIHMKSFNDFMKKQRAEKNIQLFFGKNSLKEILRCVHTGGIVGIVLDQHAGGRDRVIVPFFGRPASTLKVLAILSERTGAPVVPAYTYRDENYHHHVVIEPSLHSPTDDTPESRTLQYTEWLESVILKHPDQWMWTHNRWKTPR